MRNDGARKIVATCIDGYDYVCFLDNKTGIKGKRAEEQDLNWLNLTDESKQYYQIEYLGQEEYIGKMCDVYSMVEKLDETQPSTGSGRDFHLRLRCRCQVL